MHCILLCGWDIILLISCLLDVLNFLCISLSLSLLKKHYSKHHWLLKLNIHGSPKGMVLNWCWIPERSQILGSSKPGRRVSQCNPLWKLCLFDKTLCYLSMENLLFPLILTCSSIIYFLILWLGISFLVDCFLWVLYFAYMVRCWSQDLYIFPTPSVLKVMTMCDLYDLLRRHMLTECTGENICSFVHYFVKW